MANFNYNEVTIGGRLTVQPELTTTKNGKEVTTFTVAVKRRGKDETESDFFNVVAWENLATLVTRYFTKGSSIFVVGELRNRQWTDQNGNKRYATDVLARDIRFVDSKSEQQQTAPKEQPQKQQESVQPNYEDLGGDEELPF